MPLDKDPDKTYDESSAAAPVALVAGDAPTIKQAIRQAVAPYLVAVGVPQGQRPTLAQWAQAAQLCGLQRVADAIHASALAAGKKRNLNGPAIQSFFDQVAQQDAG